MSSMRNAVQRRNHKERAQPRERERWGLLEKHKDYALRAKDYNEKKKKLKTLRQKAAERNPDEFHFAMMSHRMQDGTKTSKKSPYASMPHDTAQLLKTQDAGYLRTVIQSTRKARQRLREELVLQRMQDGLERGHDVHADDDDDDDEDGAESASAAKSAARRHIVFVDDRAEQKAYDRPARDGRKPRPERRADVDSDGEDMSDQEKPVPVKKTAKTRVHGKGAEMAAADDMETRQRSIAAMERRLEATQERETALVAAEQELELQRAKMSNSIGGVTKAGHRFRIKERKR